MEEETKIILCPHCKHPVELKEDQQTATCPRCGAGFTRGELVAEGFEVTREELTANARRKFGKKITTKLLLVFLFLCVAFGNRGRFYHVPVISAIAAVQMVLGILALLLGYQVIPNRKPWLRICLMVLCVALVVPWVTCQFAPPRWEPEREEALIRYDQLLLGNRLPPMEGAQGAVVTDEAYVLKLELTGVDEDQCEDYVRRCQTAGFRPDDTQPYGGLRCYNKEGYGLTFSYQRPNRILRLQLEAPMDFAPFVWPRELVGDLLPDPGVEEAMVERMSNTQMEIYLKNMPRFLEYREKLEQAGFDQQVQKGPDRFSGFNANGSFVTLNDAGNGTVKLFLNLEEPDRLQSLQK